MNQSFEYENNYNDNRLPPLKLNQSVHMPSKNRSQSHNEISNKKELITRKLVPTQSLAKVDDYETMNERQLLRQHQSLLKVLKKFQEIIDLSISKKQKEKTQLKGGKVVGKQQLMQSEATNNKKIIQNYLNQIKQLEQAKKMRTLDQILTENAQVTEKINKVKKEIFSLKNEDINVGGKLVNDRGIIERQMKEHQRQLRVQLSKNSQFKKKIQELTQQLSQLKKSDGLDIQIKGNQYKKDSVLKLQQKRQELEQLTRVLQHHQESIQQVMVTKSKRNKGLIKDIEGVEKRISQITIRIENCKNKVSRFQKVLEIN